MVCALTIAAWDTLRESFCPPCLVRAKNTDKCILTHYAIEHFSVLAKRTWEVTKTKEWGPLKIILIILRHLVPLEYTVLGS